MCVHIYINTTVCILNGHLHKSPNDALWNWSSFLDLDTPKRMHRIWLDLDIQVCVIKPCTERSFEASSRKTWCGKKLCARTRCCKNVKWLSFWARNIIARLTLCIWGHCGHWTSFKLILDFTKCVLTFFVHLTKIWVDYRSIFIPVHVGPCAVSWLYLQEFCAIQHNSPRFNTLQYQDIVNMNKILRWY